MKSIWIGLFFSIATHTGSMAQGSIKGNWQVVKTKNKLAARSECSLVAVQDKLYLIGGDGPALPVEAYQHLD